MMNVENETSLVNFVCLVFELGDKTLTLSAMENLMVKCSHKNSRRSYGSRMSPQIVRRYRTDPVRCPYGVPIRLDTKRKEAAR